MPILAASQAVYLCWEDSQMQSVFKRIASSDYDIKDSFITVSYAAIMVDVAVHLIGWASVGSWTHEDIERLEVQSFVHPDYRTRGLGFSLIACVTYGIPNTNIPVAVFSTECYKIGKRLRWNVQQFKSYENNWVSVRHEDFRMAGLSKEEQCNTSNNVNK